MPNHMKAIKMTNHFKIVHAVEKDNTPRVKSKIAPNTRKTIGKPIKNKIPIIIPIITILIHFLSFKYFL